MWTGPDRAFARANRVDARPSHTTGDPGRPGNGSKQRSFGRVVTVGREDDAERLSARCAVDPAATVAFEPTAWRPGRSGVRAKSRADRYHHEQTSTRCSSGCWGLEARRRFHRYRPAVHPFVGCPRQLRHVQVSVGAGGRAPDATAAPRMSRRARRSSRAPVVSGRRVADRRSSYARAAAGSRGDANR